MHDIFDINANVHRDELLNTLSVDKAWIPKTILPFDS